MYLCWKVVMFLVFHRRLSGHYFSGCVNIQVIFFRLCGRPILCWKIKLKANSKPVLVVFFFSSTARFCSDQFVIIDSIGLEKKVINSLTPPLHVIGFHQNQRKQIQI